MTSSRWSASQGCRTLGLSGLSDGIDMKYIENILNMYKTSLIHVFMFPSLNLLADRIQLGRVALPLGKG